MVLSTALAQEIPVGAGCTLHDAVSSTLLRHPVLQMEKQTVRSQEGTLRINNGAFDPIIGLSGSQVHDYLASGSDNGPLFQRNDVTDVELYARTYLRNGMILAPSLSMVRTQGAPAYTVAQNFAVATLSLTTPLLRGGGKYAAVGLELAAKHVYSASQQRYRHNTAVFVLQTIQAYWIYVAASRNLDNVKRAERRAEEYRAAVEALIKGNELPGGEIEQVAANNEEIAAQRISVEQELVQARYALGEAMGLRYDEIESLPAPADTLPAVPIDWNAHEPTSRIIEDALSRRSDYAASREVTEAARVRLEMEKNTTLPKLDLYLAVGYSGLAVGSNADSYASALWTNVPGSNASATISYEMPVRNNEAAGRVLRADAEYQQSLLESEDLARRIASSVTFLLASVRHAITETQHLHQSVRMYAAACRHEQEKVQLGSSTFLDLLTMENKLWDAVQSELSSRLQYSIAVTRLRFETGQLVVENGGQMTVNYELLMTSP
jgi:outer membrane protein TolC